MDKLFWDSQVEYLLSTRKKMWNDDYFEFLVKNVWKLDRPKNVVDFGCGYGHLGMMLLPLLPEGSSYTGIDISDNLLAEAWKTFGGIGYKTDFIKADLTEYTPSKQYDIAVCQAVLRHIPHAKNVLQKMIDSIVPSGMVICIEVNRKMEEAGQYIHGISQYNPEYETSLRKKWEDELSGGGRDYLFGIKAPIYMEQLGLENIGVRLNDFIEFISPLHDECTYKSQMDSFIKTRNIEDIEIYKDTYLLAARSLFISFGTKR